MSANKYRISDRSRADDSFFLSVVIQRDGRDTLPIKCEYKSTVKEDR